VFLDTLDLQRDARHLFCFGVQLSDNQSTLHICIFWLHSSNLKPLHYIAHMTLLDV